MIDTNDFLNRLAHMDTTAFQPGEERDLLLILVEEARDIVFGDEGDAANQEDLGA